MRAALNMAASFELMRNSPGEQVPALHGLCEQEECLQRAVGCACGGEGIGITRL